ncbi:MAG: hypothetical protein MI919_09310 [Holophagales bacterium]|nr:hypothetical protein [Holophagales bacterium]
MDPEGIAVVRGYDLRRRLHTEAHNAGTEITTSGYDLVGNRVSLERPEGGVWTWEYDDANRLTAASDPENGRTEYRFDPADNLARLIDAEGQETLLEYDELDRLERKLLPGGAFEEYDYDENGNLTFRRDAEGQSFDYRYDERNRQIERIYPDDLALEDELDSILLAYDPNNNLLRTEETYSLSGPLATRWTYDSFDRPEEVTDRWGHRLVLTYDPNGNRTRITDPEGRVTTYAFDGLNRVESVLIPGAGTTTYDWYRNGLLEGIAYPNGTQAAMLYDGANRIQRIEHTHGLAPVSSFDYTYDRNGNRITQVDTQAGLPTETVGYLYDDADRLLEVSYPEKTVTYTYDGVGNRRTEQERDPAGTLLRDRSYLYDGRDRLTELRDLQDPSRTVVYGYDQNGNQISRQLGTEPETTFVYDTRDQLSRVEQGGLPVAAYRYDAQGLRVEKNTPEGTARYVYDQQSVLLKYGPTSTQKYDYGPDRLLSVDDTTEGRAYYLTDALGSVTNLVSPEGIQTAQYRYDAWGGYRHREEREPQPWGFTGHEMDDETGLVYMKARFYDPESARFLSEDPAEGDPSRPPSLHRYLYAYQNPTVYVDPDGRTALLSGMIESLEKRQKRLEGHRKDGATEAVFAGLAQGLTTAGTGVLRGFNFLTNVTAEAFARDTQVGREAQAEIDALSEGLASRLSNVQRSVTQILEDPEENLAKLEDPGVIMVRTALKAGVFMTEVADGDPDAISQLTEEASFGVLLGGAGGPLGRGVGSAGRRLARGSQATRTLVDDIDLPRSRSQRSGSTSGTTALQSRVMANIQESRGARIARNIANSRNARKASRFGQITDPSRILEPPSNLNPDLPGGPIFGVELPVGYRFNQAVGPRFGKPQRSPGAFGTPQEIPNVEFVRQDLAVIPEFKTVVSGKRTVEVIRPARAQISIVGPQESGGRAYRGGGIQIRILDYDHDDPFVRFVGPEEPLN